MKKYLFSYNNWYGDRQYLLVYGNNKYEARNKVPFPCTYREVTSMDDNWFRTHYCGTIFN